MGRMSDIEITIEDLKRENKELKECIKLCEFSLKKQKEKFKETCRNYEEIINKLRKELEERE